MQTPPIPGLEIAVALEPDFDLFRLGNVLELRLVPPGTLGATVTYEGHVRYVVELRFDDVRQLRIPEEIAGLTFCELEVEDIRARGMENVRYEVSSELIALNFVCAAITLVSITPL